MNTEVFNTTKNGDLTRLINLIKLFAPVNGKDQDCRTPLIWASIKGHVNCLNQLLESKADVNDIDEDGDTALAWASYNNHVECVMILLNAKANIDIENIKHKTALDEARSTTVTNIIINHKKERMIEEMVKVLPFPTAGGHIELYRWIVNYCL